MQLGVTTDKSDSTLLEKDGNLLPTNENLRDCTLFSQVHEALDVFLPAISMSLGDFNNILLDKCDAALI